MYECGSWCLFELGSSMTIRLLLASIYVFVLGKSQSEILALGLNGQKLLDGTTGRVHAQFPVCNTSYPTKMTLIQMIGQTPICMAECESLFL